MIWGLLILTFISGISCTGPIWFLGHVKEWKNTKKPFLWALLWSIVILITLPIYIILYYSFDFPDFWIPALISTGFWFLFALIYGAFMYRIKRKYKIIFESDKDKIRKKFENDPEYRAKWLAEQKAQTKADPQEDKDITQ